MYGNKLHAQRKKPGYLFLTQESEIRVFSNFNNIQDLAQSRLGSGRCLHCTLASAVLWSTRGRERCSVDRWSC